MKTFQDLPLDGDRERAQFCVDAVKAFRGTADYRNAIEAQSYYDKHNITIENFRKFLYTVSGNKIEDVWSANYKLESLIFRRLVTQQVQYVLGNGLTLTDTKDNDQKERLGKDFDFKLQMAAKIACVQGRAFGFWNLDHLEVFGYADTPKMAGFCPLYDENTAELRAGIRFWYRNVNQKQIFRATLYEEDGYTDYIQSGSDDPQEMTAKRYYKYEKTVTGAGDVDEVEGSNYSKLPIVTLYASDTHESEIVGIRSSIDCYDFIKSGFANVLDDTSEIYWLVSNSGGMGDKDLAQFLQRLKTVRAAATDSDDGQTAAPYTIDVPHEARKVLIEMLRKDIYEDFQALDVTTLSAAAKTTQEIQAAYQQQDNKCADFEYYVLDFVHSILEIAGIEGNPSFTWNRVVNMAEQTNMILSCAQYLPSDVLIKKLPFLTPEEAEEVIGKNDMDDFNRFDGVEDDTSATGETTRE